MCAVRGRYSGRTRLSVGLKLPDWCWEHANMHDSKSPFMKAAEVLEILGVAKSTLWRWYNAGNFPRPVRLGDRAVAWRRADVEEWIANRPAA